MASKYRVAVTVDQDMHNTLTALAKLSGSSVSGVVRDYLNIGRDSLKYIVSSMEAAAALEEDQKARIRERMDQAALRIAMAEEEVRKVQEETARELLGGSGQAEAQASDGPETASGSSADPRPVTRGFPTPKTRTSSAPAGSQKRVKR